MLAMRNGFSGSIHSGCCGPAFDPKGRLPSCEPTYVSAKRLLEYAASHIQHMQKALTEINLQLHHVVADITGATGLRIIRAILAGERDPEALASLRHYSCRSSVETIAKALNGSYRAEHLFALERKRYEHTRACPGCSGGYVTRANRLGIQNWRTASTTVGMSRHAS